MKSPPNTHSTECVNTFPEVFSEGVRLMCQIYATLRLKIDAIHRRPCILYAAVNVINISSQEFSTKTNTVTVEKVVIMFL